jgi:hypothetical protein
MADLKISALPASTVPLVGTEVLPIVQSSATKQVTVANLTAGRAVATGALTVTGDATLSTGNLVISTSGKGIDFSATPGTGTSELLADYEEGTWAPDGTSVVTVGTFSSSGTYTKVGKLVTVTGIVSGTTSVSIGASGLYCTTLPFTGAVDGIGSAADGTNTASGVVRASNVFVIAATTMAPTPSISFTVTYFV